MSRPTDTEAARRKPRPSTGSTVPPPPVIGSWRKIYALVLAELAALIALFYALTRWAS